VITITQIFNLARQILADVLQILGLVQLIQGQTSKTAQENVPFEIATNVAIINGVVTSGTFGNAAIKTAIDTLTSNQATEFADILSAIAAVQQAGSPVTLPATPPSGYGGATSDENATAVWAYTNFGLLTTTFGFLSSAGTWPVQAQALVTFPVMQNPLFGLSYDWGDPFVVGQPERRPIGDLTTILATDDVFSWLNRESGLDGTWEFSFANGVWNQTDFAEEGAWLFLPGVDGFNKIQADLFPTGAALTPPVWPGLAGVTLLTPVAIDVGVTITEAMDGALVSITAAPAKQGFFTFDDTLSYRNIGALAFVTDDGELEFPQLLGFTTAVYCPRTMEHAAGLKLRAIGGVTGTITPFTIP